MYLEVEVNLLHLTPYFSDVNLTEQLFAGLKDSNIWQHR